MGDGVAHVVGAEPTGDDETVVVHHALGEPPVEDLARPGVLAVDEQVVGAEFLEAGDVRITGRKGLDDERDAGADPLGLLGRLVPVKLCRGQAGRLDGLHHALGRLVAEDTDRDDLGRQSLRDVSGQLDRDLARGRGEHEPDGPGPEADREQRVRLGGDAADLDQELVVAHRGATG